MGTPEYCSPEQMAEYELKPTSDIYSLGVLMYEMLTQKTPITAENRSFQAWFRAHHEMTPKAFPTYLKLPQQLENLIMGCLAKSPSKRPQSIKEILRIITPLERKYNYQKQQNNGSTKTTFSVPQDKSTLQPLPLQQIYQQNRWPDDKPQKKIVFPCLTEAKEGTFASLWTMLEPQEVKIFEPQSTFCFNHFLFQLEPHPMILWINLLYQRNHKPKWLPCYLDLKTDIGYQISNNLVSQGLYYVLLFQLARGEKYRQLLTMKITAERINQIEKFILKSLSVSGQTQSQQSKIALKQQFETVKHKIISTIEKVKK